MREYKVAIERVTRVNREYQHLHLAVDENLKRIKPGQSLLARLDEETWHPYLRERWWAVNVRDGKVIVERPMSETYAPGQVINVLGLIGQPYRFRRTLRNVMLLAYDTPPTPLLMTIPWLLTNGIAVTLVLLGTARAYSTEHLSPEVEIVLGSDDVADLLTWDNQVMTIGWADQVFSTVAEDDEPARFGEILRRFQELRADVPKNYLFGVFRPVIPCGAGACHACMISTIDGTLLTCTDGPAYDLTQTVLPKG